MKTKRRRSVVPVKRKTATEHITITKAEYAYLSRVDALMDVLVSDNSFGNYAVIAIRNALIDLRREARHAELVEYE